MKSVAKPQKSIVEVGFGLVELAEQYRVEAGRFLNDEHRAEFGQFLTPIQVARFMASLVQPTTKDIRLLDPGAGVGSLSAAWIEEILNRPDLPRAINLTVCEIDPKLVVYLRQTIDNCRQACRSKRVRFEADVVEGDFITTAIDWLGPHSLFEKPTTFFDGAILNPPYRKINANSAARQGLREVGIETSNLYTAFLWLVLKLLTPDGQLVAITPRSFCNGPYFRPFREALLSETQLDRVHLFESRKSAFRDADVLQENIIFSAVKSLDQSAKTVISTSHGPADLDLTYREVSRSELVPESDPAQVIHLAPDEFQGAVARQIRGFTSTLADLNIQVSTGRVVDFRAAEFLIPDELSASVAGAVAPLIYPTHFNQGRIDWPKVGKKPNYLKISAETESLLVPAGNYVLVKRFSAKEEKRRITAAICTPDQLPQEVFAFENHLNYFHARGRGLPKRLAQGLATYLNSSIVDSYFRQFSGHTQVNAADLRNLPYPDRESLERIGKLTAGKEANKIMIDELLAQELVACGQK